ncbi:hypothetical protein [Nocardia sp. NPDC059228]|uniref:hypothetical protein n=1 Tax=Nocardia sp. NPDC059228 TaxID=3346777 RepID=UPI003676BBC1
MVWRNDRHSAIGGPGRRTGGYLIGPGSVVDGVAYVVERRGPIVPLPSWIAMRLGWRPGD